MSFFHSVSYHIPDKTSSFLFIFCCFDEHYFFIHPKWITCVINRMINNNVFDEDLKLCEQSIMPKLLYTKQWASLQIEAVFWFATSCSLDVNDRKLLFVVQNWWMWSQRAHVLCDSNLIWTTGIQTSMDFETWVLTFLHFTTIMLKLAAVSEKRNKLFFHLTVVVLTLVGMSEKRN